MLGDMVVQEIITEKQLQQIKEYYIKKQQGNLAKLAKKRENDRNPDGDKQYKIPKTGDDNLPIQVSKLHDECPTSPLSFRE